MGNKVDLEKILPLVQRPGRYIDHELNAHRKENKGQPSICLCFPDMYEVGASNLGLEILYHLVNETEDAVAERCYAPAPDMEELMRKEKIPLFSLESQAPLSEFDMVGFSLQYELCSTNVLNMIDLAGLPIFASERGNDFPLLIGGGPMTANPEPLADFFDAFVLGDGEGAIREIIAVIRKSKSGDGEVKFRNKPELLESLAQIKGVYVPSLYSVNYKIDGTIESIKPLSKKTPNKVIKNSVKLDEVFFPSRKIVPYIQTVHNRLNVEIARGCPGKCRFCQAAKYYSPWRLRSPEKILEIVKEGLDSTGYEEVSFSSLSCTQYKGLDRLLSDFNDTYSQKRISVSLPSLRCDQFSVRVAKTLSANKRTTLTFAPEAGTERLRSVIGKYLSEQEIKETLLLAAGLGWHTVKLYFMVGLPTETEEDIEGINQLVRSVRRDAKKLDFNITISPFVPKAQTPFQWVAMGNPEILKARVQRLNKVLPATVKGHFVDSSILEGVFARGDRRLSEVIVKAWRKGCKFDQWKEYFRNDLWQESFQDAGLSQEFYIYRDRTEDEVLPWDHLSFGVEKDVLWKDYSKIFETVDTNSVKSESSPPIVPSFSSPKILPQLKTVSRLRMRFARKGMLRFLSHLEQIEVFRRAMRRANLPLSFTSGFSPQPRISFGPAISVGYESKSEYVEVELARNIGIEEAIKAVSKAVPEGFELLSLKKVPLFFPSLDSLVNVADYRIGLSIPDEQIKKFFAQSEIIIEKRKRNRVENIDVRPLVRELRNEEDGLYLQLRFGPKRTVKAEKIVQELCSLDDNDVKLVSICREELWVEKRDGSLSSL